MVEPDAARVDVEATIALGRRAMEFGQVRRITYHPDGEAESDTTHSVMLGLIACAFAAEHLPELDLGRIAQYALVHDLVEVHAGDTPTLRIDDAGRAAKADRERLAYLRLYREFGESYPWLCCTIACYETSQDAESRYVRALDKLLPKITHILNDGRTFAEQAMSRAELDGVYAAQLDSLRVYAADFPPLFELRTQLIGRIASIRWSV